MAALYVLVRKVEGARGHGATHVCDWVPFVSSSLTWTQVETGLAGSSRRVRLVAMGLVVFLLSYATAYAETLTIAHVSQKGGGASGRAAHRQGTSGRAKEGQGMRRTVR